MNKIFKECLDTGRINPEPLFECEGKKAYVFANDGAMMSQGRFESYGDIMRAYKVFNLDVEDVQMYLSMTEANNKKMLDYLHDPESLKEIILQNVGLQREFEARREYSVPMGLMYDFMSFVAVEEDENPLIYDEQYNKEKIKRWKKSLDVEKKIAFLPIIVPLFPDLRKVLELDSLNSIRVANLTNATTLRIFQKLSSMDGANKDIMPTITSRMETLHGYDNLLTELSKIITDTQPQDTQDKSSNKNNLEVLR